MADADKIEKRTTPQVLPHSHPFELQSASLPSLDSQIASGVKPDLTEYRRVETACLNSTFS